MDQKALYGTSKKLNSTINHKKLPFCVHEGIVSSMFRKCIRITYPFYWDKAPFSRKNLRLNMCRHLQYLGLDSTKVKIRCWPFHKISTQGFNFSGDKDYADRLSQTTRYIMGVVFQHRNRSAKNFIDRWIDDLNVKNGALRHVVRMCLYYSLTFSDVKKRIYPNPFTELLMLYIKGVEPLGLNSDGSFVVMYYTNKPKEE